jgi:Transcriptional regulators
MESIHSHSVYQKVIENISTQIQQGTFQVGQRLPSERDFAARLGVARGSLREALRTLQQQGILETRPNGRYLVRTTWENETDSLYQELEKAELADLIEARFVLEDKIVALACERATTGELKLIKETLSRAFSEFKRSPDYFVVTHDNLFHLAIVNAAHNVVFSNIYNANLELLRKLGGRAMRSPKRKQEILNEHTNICNAILDRDSVMARLAVRVHLRNISRQHLGTLELKPE